MEDQIKKSNFHKLLSIFSGRNRTKSLQSKSPETLELNGSELIQNFTRGFIRESDFSQIMPNMNKNERNEDNSNEGLFNISNLPVEIISLIFSHLDFYDKKNASICCKRWRYVFLDSSFLKTISIKANNNLFTARPLSSQNSLTNLNNAPRHRASSAIALISYSSSSFSNFNLYLYTNAINLEFFGDSADVSLFLKNLGNFIIKALNYLKNLKYMNNLFRL